MEQVKAKVEKQEVEISYIKKSLDEIVGENRKQSNQLQTISDSIQKQELILEKISNLEEKYYDGSKRLHSRIDEENKHHELRLKALEECCNSNKDDILNRPCRTHDVLAKDIENINKRLDDHKKIFWTAISTVMLIVVGAIVQGVMK